MKSLATDISNRTVLCQRMNIRLIWLDTNINKNHADYLRNIINDVCIFTDVDQCIDFLTDISREQVFLIISGALCQNIVPLIHNVIQLHTIFLLCQNQTKYEEWAKEWPKVKGAFTKISSICETLKHITLQWDKNDIPAHCVSTKEYMNYYPCVFRKAGWELKNIDELQNKYYNEDPIYWYMYEGFLYSMLNYTLRLMWMNIIFGMDFFIVNPNYYYSQHLYFEQCNADSISQTSTGHSAPCMSKSDFIGILFIMVVHAMKSTIPSFTSMNTIRHNEDNKEVLFSTQIVSRIDETKSIDKNSLRFQMNLKFTNDNNKDLFDLLKWIQEEMERSKKWNGLEQLFARINEMNRIQQIYEALGLSIDYRGEFKNILKFPEIPFNIKKQSLPSNHLNLIYCVVNTSLTYYIMSIYPKLLFSYEKALDIRQQCVL